MNNYTIKIVANKVLMTGEGQTRKKFDDYNQLVKYVNEKSITLVNPEILPTNFQNQLTQK